VPIPSRELRDLIEGMRAARSADPQHEREQNDAIPLVLQWAWRETARVAHELRIASTATSGESPYDPQLYEMVYRSVLRHRRCQPLPLTIRLPTEKTSAHDVGFPHAELLPAMDEVRAQIERVELRYAEDGSLEREVERWYAV
jgi:hypothetical protein